MLMGRDIGFEPAMLTGKAESIDPLQKSIAQNLMHQ